MKSKLKFVLLGGIALFCGYAVFKWSLYLAAMRIYQVDECQNVFVARILALGKLNEAYVNLSLLQLPLSWLARGATGSADLFASARLLAVVIFWLNLLLIGLATGERLLSNRILIALIGAATLAPLWDYGFEIRHDNLLLTGLLLFWCVVRNTPAIAQSFVFAGAVTVALQFVAFKAFVYTLPLSLLMLVFPRVHPTARWKLALAWAAGAIGMFLLFRLAYGAAGLWDLFVSDTRRVLGDASGNNRFAAWATLNRLLTQTPLLVAMLAAGLITVVLDLRRRGRASLTWDGWLPEASLLAIAFMALMLNPMPFAYNLVNLVPFAFLFVYRYAVIFLPALWGSFTLRPLGFTALIFAHLVPFGVATKRHLDWSNFRQTRLMELAESLTDPGQDRVYDGVGMVPTRRSINFHWYLHSLNIRDFRKGGELRVREMLAERPATVIIPSYRTDWLPEEDHQFIREHYVALGDDFWVLGTTLPKSGGRFEVIHPGRYQISWLKQSSILGNYPESLGDIMKAAGAKQEDAPFVGTLDGMAVSNRPVELTVGTHRVESAGDDEVALVWVGPRLDKVPQVGRGDHRQLFVNWY